MAVTAGSRPAWPPWWPAGLAWTLWALAIPGGFAVVVRLDNLLRQAGRPDLGLLNPNQYAYVLTLVSAATVGAVLASRRPRHPVGWLLLALELSVVAAGVAQGYAGYGLLVRPGSHGSAAGFRLRGLDEVVSVKVRRDGRDGFGQLHRKSRPCHLVEVRRSSKHVSDTSAEQVHKVAGSGPALRDPGPTLLRLKVQPDQALLDRP
jgi:hypothetical protein